MKNINETVFSLSYLMHRIEKTLGQPLIIFSELSRDTSQIHCSWYFDFSPNCIEFPLYLLHHFLGGVSHQYCPFLNFPIFSLLVLLSILEFWVMFLISSLTIMSSKSLDISLWHHNSSEWDISLRSYILWYSKWSVYKPQFWHLILGQFLVCRMRMKIL